VQLLVPAAAIRQSGQLVGSGEQVELAQQLRAFVERGEQAADGRADGLHHLDQRGLGAPDVGAEELDHSNDPGPGHDRQREGRMEPGRKGLRRTDGAVVAGHVVDPVAFPLVPHPAHQAVARLQYQLCRDPFELFEVDVRGVPDLDAAELFADAGPVTPFRAKEQSWP